MTRARTRFQPPVGGLPVVPRGGVLARLQHSPPHRLTTIVAPAGYGKTSIAAQWYDLVKRRGGRPVWVPLEAEDCEQSRFLTSLMEAVDPLLPDEGRVGDDGSMSTQTQLSVLLTRLRRCRSTITLFLDDYHLAQTDATESLLARILASSDLSHVKFVLISRSTPHLATSALRLAGELRQIGVAELSFSDAEAHTFFQSMGVRLTDEQIVALNRRTEGWAVALQMVGVLVGEATESDAILSSFDGSNADMGRYLSEQVFSSLPADIRDLLVESASLPAISRALIAAVSDRPDAAALFGRLGDHALPIALLDRQGTWIRCHPVFNGFLREEAERVGIDEVAVLRRAARWFQARGDCDAAVRHAFLANDIPLATRIVEDAGGWRRVYATSSGGGALFQKLIARAAEISLRDCPLTTLGMAVVSAKAGQLDAANHYLTIAERTDGGEALARDLRVVRLLLSLYMDRWASAADLSALEADLARGSDLELVHRALALNMLSYNFLIRTDLERALHYGRLAMLAFRDGGADYGAIHLYTHIGQATFFNGDSAGAEEAYRSLIAEAQTNIGPGSDLDAVGQVLLSEVLSMRGEQAAAVALLAWALPHLERHDTWFDLLAAGFMAQQRVLRLGGDPLAAHAAIDATRAAARRRGFDRLTRLIDAERIMLMIAGGELEEARRQADICGLNTPRGLSDGANNLAVHLRGPVPSLVWTRLHLAEGDVPHARSVFDRLITHQAQPPHVPRRIELDLVDIRLSIAEGREDRAVTRLSHLVLSQPVADYRAIFQIEGAEFGRRLRALAHAGPVSEMVRQRLEQVLRTEAPRDVAAEGAHASDRADAEVRTRGLTDRERDVIRLLSAGLGNKEIGRRLNLSDNTVKFHLRNIFAKLKVTTRTAAVMAARDLVLSSPRRETRPNGWVG